MIHDHQEYAVFWFRRDLRLEDNVGLFHALRSGLPVIPLFIFDRLILDQLSDHHDSRVEFIHQALSMMQEQCITIGTSLIVRYGDPLMVWEALCQEYPIRCVYTNHDYEPYAIARDRSVAEFLRTKGVVFHTFKDQVIFEKSDVLSGSQTPYTVFTPYCKKWKEQFDLSMVQPYLTNQHYGEFAQMAPQSIPPLETMGFSPCGQVFPSKMIQESIVATYHDTRNSLELTQGTTRLSVHLRFGTISIRSAMRTAIALNQTWWNELIWREFYMMILWHFPHTVERAFKPPYDAIIWRNNHEEFERWCKGTTGYPIVDAGMRELNATGFMHNRARMITASFLTKHLLIDWRWGEKYFAQKLLDFDCSANNGGWQWAAGTGCDAAPYFRVFNPTLQAQKFDPKAVYTRRWVPEYHDVFIYPAPIVEHSYARNRALETYKQALKS
jgi:deoxyribodipyrimidine photo-lyase